MAPSAPSPGDAAPRRSEVQYRATLAALEEGVILRDAGGRIQAANDAVNRILDGDPWCADEAVDERRDLIREDGTPMGLAELPYREVLETGRPVRRKVFGFLRRDGRRTWVQATGQPLFEDGTLQGVVCSLSDITDHRSALEALHRSEQELSSLLAALPDLIFHLDARGTFLDYRGTYPDQLVQPPATFLGRSIHQVLPALAEPTLAAIRTTLQTGRPQRFCYTLSDASGQERPFEARIIPHREDEVLAIVRDLTDLQRQERAAQAALRTKELLLKEIHHRVKNNLQVVSSLLRLQAASHPHPAVQQALQEAQERIQAIALIHQRLKHTPDASRLDLPSYVQTLAERLVRSYASAPALVDLQVQVDPVQLEPDDAVPLGLLLNELVSNALQHAFPPGQGGSLEITIRQAGDTEVKVQVSDSGQGLPAGTDLQHGGLGFQLVQALAGQLGAALELERRKGAAFRLAFTPRPSRGSHDA